MAIITNITDAQSNIGINTLNNGTNSIQLVSTYDTFDSAFDSNLLVDLYIESLNGFKINEAITISINNTSIGSFTISTDTKAIWLSELTGIPRVALNLKTTETIKFDFTSNKLLKFILVSATSANFIPASTVQTSGLGSNMYQLAISDIASKDESSVGAISNAISESKTAITGNGTNTIVITNSYPVWGNALPKDFVMDNCITFNKLLPMESSIYIKKDGYPIKTYTTTANVKNIYLSDILGISKEFLYQKVNEVYELNFIYPATINNQIITGELTNFTTANSVAIQLPQNLFELANSHTLDSIPISVDNCNFILEYSSSDNSIESAKLELNDQQSVNLSFITNNTVADKPITLVKLSNLDQVYNVEIDLIMDIQAIKNYIMLLQNFGRRQIELNSTTTITTS